MFQFAMPATLDAAEIPTALLTADDIILLPLSFGHVEPIAVIVILRTACAAVPGHDCDTHCHMERVQ